MSALDQCPGCGRMYPPKCECTPAEIRAQLVKDRAELSDRAAAFTARANEAAGLLQQAIDHAQTICGEWPADSERVADAAKFIHDVEAWLEAKG